MKIYICPRAFIEKNINEDPSFVMGKTFISIYSTADSSPLPDRYNVLKLMFDDVTEKEASAVERFGLALFDEEHAGQIVEFIKNISRVNPVYVHCDAGISRSGAVGSLLNDYFNKYLHNNEEDFKQFFKDNKWIIPNPRVTRILKKALFDDDYKVVYKDYTYDRFLYKQWEEAIC